MSNLRRWLSQVQHLIERCMTFGMSMEECMEALAKRADVQPVVTSTGPSTVMPHLQIWISSTRTLSKTRTRTNLAYAFVLALRKKVNSGVEMHLALGFIFQ
jgi:hypothetical protein